MCRLVNLTTNDGSIIRVADIKKDSISNIINAAEKCANISEVILFGSSLKEKCRDNSDIDIAIVSNVPRSKLFNSKSYKQFTSQVYLYKIGQDYDILQFNSLQDLANSKEIVCHDIRKDGKVIFRRSNNV
ncbi:MAG: nucleotidyltransferase domain-containing protein [Lachnospiraceae bacterium]|nr:nucleotidyltransferase domain-containing protein [Lachnospiraceae bacterium]